jgi:hypothetical protein
MMVLCHRSPQGTFSIRHVLMGPAITHPRCLQFIIKVSTRSFLHATCTCGTLLDPTCGTWRLTCHLYLWGLSPSNLWDLTACVSLVLVDPSPSDLWDPTTPFSISIRPVGPDGLHIMCPTCGTRQHLSPSPSDLWDPTACISRVWLVGPDGTFLHLHLTCGTRPLACHLWTLSPSDLWDSMACMSLVDPFSIRPVGPDGLHVTCTYGTFFYLHSTCGTWWLACHLLSPGFNKFKLKKPWDLGVEPRT